MNSMREVGGHLFACGDGGQIYRRQDDGTWTCLDTSLLQPPQVPATDRDMFHRIGGPSATEVYIVGRFGKILYWDGSAVRRISSQTNVMLNDILVEDRDRIWICGREGTLLRGNARDGFAQVPGSGGQQTFATMTMFQDKLYLASSAKPRALYVYRGNGFDRVTTGLDPDLVDIHTVDSGYGALWTVGSKDILRFDGKSWERIDFPGNTPVRP
jgi:hypothetical protein